MIPKLMFDTNEEIHFQVASNCSTIQLMVDSLIEDCKSQNMSKQKTIQTIVTWFTDNLNVDGYNDNVNSMLKLIVSEYIVGIVQYKLQLKEG